MTGDRMIWRWNLRMVRQEWRQLTSIGLLIALSVGIGVGAVLAAYNLAPPPEQVYGNGSVKATVVGAYEAQQEAFEDRFYEIGVVRTLPVGVPGSIARLELRSQQPEDAVAAPTASITEGTWPSGGETAVTDEIATRLGLELGSVLALEGFSLEVVGFVENPTDLADEFALAADLEQLPIDQEAIETDFLIAASVSEVSAAAVGPLGVQDPGEGIPSVRALAATGVSIVFGIGMLQVGLLAGAGFTVLSRRRSRQYGLLAATGATPRQVGRAAAISGIITGSVGSLIGVIAAVVVVGLAVPGMEELVGHRIEMAWPWWGIVPGFVLGVAAAGIAAWWPARALSRRPIVEVLASLRPRPAATDRSSLAGFVLAVIGTVLFLYGMSESSTPLALLGSIGTLTGGLLVSPTVVRRIGAATRHLPLVFRIAGRGVARQQGRSAAVIAAIAVALAIATSVLTTTAAMDRREASGPGNLPDDMAIAWLDLSPDNELVVLPDVDPMVVAETEARLATTGMTVVPIVVPIDPAGERITTEFARSGPASAIVPELALRPVKPGSSSDEYDFGELDAKGADVVYSPHRLWVGTDEMLSIWGLAYSEDAAVVARWESVVLLSEGPSEQSGRTPVSSPSDFPTYESFASALIEPTVVESKGMDLATIGWLLVNDGTITAAERAAVSSHLGGSVLLEFREEPRSTSGVRTAGVIILTAIGLVILLTAVRLAKLESAGDAVVLSAIGATRATLRSVSAASALLLAGCGALIAVPLGFLAQLGLLVRPHAGFSLTIPWLQLAIVAVAFPLVGAAASLLGDVTTSDRRAM